jgi:hypothetical protein
MSWGLAEPCGPTAIARVHGIAQDCFLCCPIGCSGPSLASTVRSSRAAQKETGIRADSRIENTPGARLSSVN